MPQKKMKETEKKITLSKENKKTKKISQKDFEKKVLELSEKGLTSEKIGQELKNQGIHPKNFEKKISKILGEKYSDPELGNIEKKLEGIKKHYKNNKQDKRAMREKDRVFAKLRKVKKYLKLIK